MDIKIKYMKKIIFVSLILGSFLWKDVMIIRLLSDVSAWTERY